MQRKEFAGKHELNDETPDLRGEIEAVGKKSIISRILRRRELPPDAPLPTKWELKEHIEKLFSLSEKSQPSKMLNAGAGVADSASLLLAANQGNVLFGAGAVVSELVAWAKNRDKQPFSEARKRELSELEECKRAVMSKLKRWGKDERVKELMKETEELFSDIEKYSKKGMTSALGSRLEGFAGSALALVSFPFYKPYADMVSSYLEAFIRSQPYQPPGFNPDPIVGAVYFASWFASYVVASGLLAYGVEWVRERISGRVDQEDREEMKKDLGRRAEALLDKINSLGKGVL